MFSNRVSAKIMVLFGLLLLVNTGCHRQESIVTESTFGTHSMVYFYSIPVNDCQYHGRVEYANDKYSVVVLAAFDHYLPPVGSHGNGKPSLILGNYPKHFTTEDIFKDNKTVFTMKEIDSYYVYFVSGEEILDKIDYETLGLKKNYDSTDSCREDMEPKLKAWLEKRHAADTSEMK